MRELWLAVYNVLGIPVMWIAFRILAVFNSKIREGLNGRRDLFSLLDRSLSVSEGKKVVIHSSSLGEYQQSVPLADELVRKGFCVIHSFFSPSGYRNCRVSGNKRLKTYLPFDSYSSSEKFLRKINPEMLIFMRYDLWYNMVYIARKKGVKLVVANARFDEHDRTWTLPVVSSFKKTMYRMLNDVFVIDEFDEKNYRQILEGYGPKVIKAGDSKFERVLNNSAATGIEGLFEGAGIEDKKIFVMGSSWKDDEEVILPAVNKAMEYDKDILVILVPHEPKETKIQAIEKSLSRHNNISHIRLSSLGGYSGENLIIVDRVGILSRLYSVAYASYVGGGFRTGLHNILEPAIFNMPIFFANKFKNSDEDEILIAEGCGIPVTDTKQFYRRFREIFTDRKLRDETGLKCREVFRNSAGIAESIVNHITK